MKLMPASYLPTALGSPPAWGAWIETHGRKHDAPRDHVAPRVGGVD